MAEQYAKAAHRIDRQERVTTVVNNGHTVQVNCTGADLVTINGQSFGLVQFHFHSPREHTIDSKSFPMEMHLLHQAADGGLAVIGVLIEEGSSDNSALDSLWANLPAAPEQEIQLRGLPVKVDPLLPVSRVFYRYDGSLTPPPCSEGVRWLVMKSPISLSRDQIASFRTIIHDNNRPTRPLHGHVVALQSFTATH